ncbi:class I SAM-dependent methyltransferase [Pseudomonas sp. 5P_3.1_Bac2]|uniref:class I SAM-dependent methyltransferase n=1 Tax=Pseudomonas sp. 5P_3.1_Bac2 TaxID=2971617 RepID=UPI0021C6C923|nr:class I SAM-dependent methyltransferase [Pseudomonas sp. 5P_3.1_Bac2]MCU1715792.1 class I SAM-dependent methyltransferase [Pseudomonas sp. 5P_3.1_Bac2]
MQRDHREQLNLSWQANADAWTAAVREQRIESRRLVTDAAIVQAILALEPKRVLDLGCGEGWLCRGLIEHGIEAVGVDASEPLIAVAKKAAGGAQYRVCGYAELPEQAAQLGLFDVLVCNFALLEEPLAPTLEVLHQLLARDGRLLIQTLHPWRACNDASYRDGWRVETFAGFGEGFAQPMPWFFRTLESWLALFSETGWRLQWLQEPLHPESEQPVSLLLLLSSERQA